MLTPSVTLIAGPTASGKSRLALERAQATGAAILNADSQQLYADLRVLTARPSAEDEALAEHRLYGVADAADAWSVGRWLRAATTEIESLEGRPVVIVGGTGLYFHALAKGLADIPQVSPEARAHADGLFATEGEVAFRRRLRQVDPLAEARIMANDRQRLVRAWAVFAATGRALSAWQGAAAPWLAEGSYDAVVIEPDRNELYARCDLRAEAMLAEGALDEVQALMARGLDPALPAMKAVGVREIAAYLAADVTREAALDALKQATRNYAKRQLTWFRNQTPDWARLPC